MRTKSYDTLEKEAIAESLGISLNKYKYIERRIAESDNPNDTVENWVKEGKIRQRKTKEEVKEDTKEDTKEEVKVTKKEKENDTKDTKEDKKDKKTDTDSDTNTESDNETKDSIVNNSVEIKEEKAFKSISTKHVCDRCHSKIKDSEYKLNLSYLINGLAGYRFRINSNRVKLCHDCAIELGRVVEEWLINNGNGVKVKPWMGDNKENKEDREEDKEVDGFDDFNF